MMTGPLEFSPASMPSSNLDEEIFACSENSDDCSCSDLLTSSLDLTIYGHIDQVDQAGWDRFDYPEAGDPQQQQHFTFTDDTIVGQQQLQQQQQQQQHQQHPQSMIMEIALNPADESYYSSHASWDDLSTNRVLSILEPGLDFEGLIDLDNL